MGLAHGQVLDGKYVIDRLLAQGGMGEVYLGTNLRIGGAVAVKVLHPHYANDPTCVERFEREARIAARIRSEHVTDVYDLGALPSGERFMVMELLEGETLADRMAREGRIAPPVIARIALQVLDALAAAHAVGVVHRDLKPENIFLSRGSRDDFVKLVDFGISKLDDPRDTKRVTAVGAVLGTPMYMSPEQAKGQPVDHRSDLFALGVVLYEVASGLPPFDAESPHQLLLRIAEGKRVPLRQRLPNVDPTLERIVERAMMQDRDERWQTAEEMREAVLAWESVFSWGSGLRASLAALDSIPPPSTRRFADRASTLPGEAPVVRDRGGADRELAQEPTPSSSSPSVLLGVVKRPGGAPSRTRAAASGVLLAAATACVAFAPPAGARGDLAAHVLTRAGSSFDGAFGAPRMLEDDLPTPPHAEHGFVVPAAVPTLEAFAELEPGAR